METESHFMIIFLFQNQHWIDFCEPYLTKLGTNLALDHETKFVLQELNYNFYLGPTAMHAF